jgi:hypothetical protein
VHFEQTDEWASRHRHMQVEAFSKIDTAEVDTIPGMTTEAARSCPQAVSQSPPT